MEDKIEIGEFVRTENGIIGKLRGSYLHGENIEYPEPQEWVIDRFNNRKNYYVISEADTDPDYIVKHSKRILDLIEVGDIVELVDALSQEVIYVWDKEMLEAVKQDIEEGQTLKSILTREEFTNRKYKVGEQ